MWNKRKEEDTLPKPAAVPPSAPPPTRETAMATQPIRTMEPEQPRGVAAIGKSVVIKGQIFSREDLYLDGEMEGTVEVPDNRLTIGPHGKIKAGIKAREVTVLGAVQGNVEAGEKLEVRKDGRLTGDIRTGRIVIEDGAYFKGSIDIVRAEASGKPQKEQKETPQPVAAPAPVTAGNGR